MSLAPISLHVYKGGSGIWNSDRTVKTADKDTVLYHLVVTRHLVGWKSTLHAQGQGGPVVIEMTKANLTSSPSDILIQNLLDGWTTRLRQDDFLATNNLFIGPDGRNYRWKWSSVVSLDNSLQCVNDENDLIASYRCCSMALHKDGELIIFHPGLFMVDILVATGLAMRTTN